MTPLCKLAQKYGSDKCPQILHFYTEYYYGLLKDKKQKFKKILEVGVGSVELMPHCPNYVNGASLHMWRDFFPKAQIYGADIVPELVFKKDRIETFLCNASLKEDLLKLIEKTGTDIDLFIDDGSHHSKHQIFTCAVLMPLLKKDVIYIIEDVADTNVAKALEKYDCKIIRRSRMKNSNDRLIVVTNKNV